MRRGAIWWANLPPPWDRRPVVLLAREAAYRHLNAVVVAPLTRSIRDIESHVVLEPTPDGVPYRSAITLDNIQWVRVEWLDRRIAQLRPEKLAELDLALHFALGITTCPEPI